MGFIAYTKQLRTYDPERDFELKREMGMSDGAEFTQLVAPDSSLNSR